MSKESPEAHYLSSYQLAPPVTWDQAAITPTKIERDSTDVNSEDIVITNHFDDH